MYHVSAQGVDECMINVHYYYYGNIQLSQYTQVTVIRIFQGNTQLSQYTQVTVIQIFQGIHNSHNTHRSQ